jgi:hypothetical protein
MSLLESTRFPRASAYLASLPLGLASHPQCTARTDTARLMLAEFPQLLATGVTAGLVHTLEKTIRGAEVFPDVMSVLLRLLVRDAAFRDDQGFLEWNQALSARVFSSPVYRVLMHVLSPTLVLTGAQRRWNAYRTGTHLSSEGTRDGATLKLASPAGLYPELVARSYAELFRAALLAARAQDVQIAMVAHEPALATYRLSWH